MDLINLLTEEQKNSYFSKTGYSEERLKEDLIHLKEWLKEQEHLPPARLTETDEFLQFFLTGCKGNLDTAKSKLDSYYTCRSKSEIFDKRDPLSTKHKMAADLCEFAVMPHTTKEGVRIIYASLKTSDVTNFDYTDMIKKLFNLGELTFRMEKYHVGYFVIFNCCHFTVSHVLKIRLQIIKDAIMMMQEVLPVRIAGVLLINASYFFELTANNVIFPFLSKKMKNRFHVSSKGVEIVSNYLDIKLLPKDFGGDEEPLKVLSDKWMHKEIQQREWYINELSQHTDETKRKTKDNDQISRYTHLTNRIKTYFGSMIPQWKKVENKQ